MKESPRPGRKMFGKKPKPNLVQLRLIHIPRAGEHSQMDMGVSRVRNWANRTGLMGDEDIFISADVDEIISRSTLHQLRWCKTSAGVMSGGLWMPMGNLNKAVRSGFHVQDKPHAFSFPTIYTWDKIRTQEFDGRRLFHFDFKGKYLTGGFHMTNNAFLPTSLLKEMTNTEDNFYNGNINLNHLLYMNLKDMSLEQERLYTFYYRQMWEEILDPVETVHDIDFELPWFLDCNRDRFPYWFGQPDGRNVILLQRMAALRKALHFGGKHGMKSSHLFTAGFYNHPDKYLNNTFITKILQK